MIHPGFRMGQWHCINYPATSTDENRQVMKSSQRLHTINASMTIPLRHQFPYSKESAKLFAPLRQRPWAVYLDSCQPWSAQGRYDLIAADPMVTLTTRGEVTEIITRDGVIRSTDDPFSLLQLYLQPNTTSDDRFPFTGGAIGYFGYDLGRRLEHLPDLANKCDQQPEMAIGIYDWVLQVDHRLGECWLLSRGHDPATHDKWQQLIAQFSQVMDEEESCPFRVEGALRSNMTQAEYQQRFQRIQHYIHEGDCYQVNFAQRFELPVSGNPWSAYRKLRQVNPAPFAAYFNLPDLQLLSFSPERFLHVSRKQVETKPIKGTLPRDGNPQRDHILAEQLQRSEKDRAENLMIVDLLRNDLGKSCKPGSVEVPSLFNIESFTSVHHLVSTVTGELAADKSAIDLLKGCFPGGSITGAPKLRAMQIIEELEPDRRGIYCGSIGYLGFDGDMDCNIAIRTLIHTDGKLSFSAGGGIVADSDPEAEYAETFHKISAILAHLQAESPE